ncbi:serine protease [Paraburkholderia hospita]|uniref:Serine protease n=1 Tax=Paraburkholderia hospita TaxID=169430 RepID=A0AAN1JKB9_9BURK|nr:CAP domain-containing protein [Paraburkholderia hospita]AUT75436.1 serine protease [Paraburkholderia hospita]
MNKNISALTAVSFAAAIALSACGGGGGGNGGSTAAAPSTPASSPTTGNVTTPQYASTSAQLAVFNTLNQQRQQCGLPAFTENTVLDQAAQAHADYQGLNGGLITDTEDSSKPGFTGMTYSDRAVKAGFPGLQTTYSGGASAGFYTNATLTETQYGTNIAYAWMSGVYHISVAAWPVTEIGVGWKELTFNGFPQIVSSVSIANLQTLSGNLPLTFPCQGSSGLPYSTGGETPVPPNTSGNFGQPVAVIGNQTDTITLQSGTMTDTSGTVVNLQLLNSSNDPNKLLPAWEAVAYPAAPLTANTSYTVSLSGTRNGTPFSRTFTFTTGNIIG